MSMYVYLSVGQKQPYNIGIKFNINKCISNNKLQTKYYLANPTLPVRDYA